MPKADIARLFILLISPRYKGRQSAKAKTLSAKRLRKLLNYAPATGIFRWRVRRGGPKTVDHVAGGIHPSKGYRQICVDGKLYRANRLAWLYMTGKWPKLEIGYINRNISDTRWANLRAMTPSQRGATSRRRNKHGVRGIWITKSGKYVARITVAGKKKYLGLFDTIEKANVAYTRAAKDAFGRFARAR
ncbi:MAG: HNH endonuclease [Pseudolabrys sp.]